MGFYSCGEMQHLPFWQEQDRRSGLFYNRDNTAIHDTNSLVDEPKSSILHEMTNISLESDKNLEHLVTGLFEDYFVADSSTTGMARFDSQQMPVLWLGARISLNGAANFAESDPGPGAAFVRVDNITIEVVIQGVQFGSQDESAPVPNVENQLVQHSPVSSRADALFFLQYVVMHSNTLLDQIRKVFKDVSELNEDTIGQLEALKEALINYTSAVDKALQEYIFMAEGDHTLQESELMEILRCKEEMMDIIKSLSPENLSLLVPEVCHLSPEHILCSILGVDSKCAEWLNEMPEDVRYHQTLQYWVERFVEDRANMREDEMEECENEDSGYGGMDSDMVEELVAYGFTPSRATIIKSALENQENLSPQTLLYWAKYYLNEKFNSDILLNSAPRYPYNKDKRQEWCCVEINTEDRYWDQEEGEEAEPTQAVNIINLNGYHDLSYQTRDEAAYPPQSDEEHLIFFHATNHNSAKSLIEDGVMLNKGHAAQDFSGANRGGFYLSLDINVARDRAQASRFSPKSAIVIYKVPRQKFSEFEHLQLCDDREAWTEIVKFNRSGGKIKLSKNLKKVYKSVDVIEGPMCTFIPAKRGGNPTGFERDALKQTCLLSDEVSGFVGDIRHIDGVLFYNEPQ